MKAADGVIPDGALPAGQSEDGEKLFVGRAEHEGTLTLGKVKKNNFETFYQEIVTFKVLLSSDTLPCQSEILEKKRDLY